MEPRDKFAAAIIASLADKLSAADLPKRGDAKRETVLWDLALTAYELADLMVEAGTIPPQPRKQPAAKTGSSA